MKIDQTMFWSQVDTTEQLTQCWMWQGGINSGYGYFVAGRSPIPAHRISYQIYTGTDIPDGLEIDHTCDNKLCVRPEHLEAVSRSENLRRRYLSKLAKRKWTCAHGHKLTPENISSDGKCRTCHADAERRRRQRRK